MSKWIRSLALMTALAALSAGTVSVAQEKGKAAKKVAKVGTIEYYKNDKGKWRFIIKDENDKSIVMPLAQISYESKDETLKAIENLKKILTEVKPTERAEKK
jgi:uncharacterized protein YegP (UPF0339 family)